MNPEHEIGEFFKAKEFLCPCCGAGKIAKELVTRLDGLRMMLGYPIRVNSGCRCPKHNKEVGGAARSRHLIGCAADIQPVITGKNRMEITMIMQTLLKIYFSGPEDELIRYPSGYFHVAVPRKYESECWELIP
jgi:hypothetical protein